MARSASRSGYWSDLPPKTPRMSSVALPTSPVVNSYPRKYAPAATPLMNSRPFMPPNQLPPPTPSSGRRHTLPQENHPLPRLRTSSNVSIGTKPLKGILKKPSPPVEVPPSKPGFLKSILKRTHSTKAQDHYYTDSEQLVKPSEAVPARRSSLKSSNDHHARKGSQDSSDRTSSKGRETPIEELKKAANLMYSYDRDIRIPVVEKSRLKAEVISLNWVLRSQEGLRKRTRENANLCRVFDMAFQPDPHPHNPYGRYKPGARLWDIVHRMYLPDQTVRTYFEMPASSHCNLYKMHIVVSANPEWYTIVERKRGIRCIDVFRAVYDMLQKPLTRRELSMIPHGSIQFCEDAQDARIKDSPVLEEVERSRGILRIDSFVNYRFFKGLTQKDDVWMLETCHCCTITSVFLVPCLHFTVAFFSISRTNISSISCCTTYPLLNRLLYARSFTLPNDVPILANRVGVHATYLYRLSPRHMLPSQYCVFLFCTPHLYQLYNCHIYILCFTSHPPHVSFPFCQRGPPVYYFTAPFHSLETANSVPQIPPHIPNSTRSIGFVTAFRK